jgi:hypothetical protein
MAKLNRESRLRERRADKEARRVARRDAAAQGLSSHDGHPPNGAVLDDPAGAVMDDPAGAVVDDPTGAAMDDPAPDEG